MLKKNSVVYSMTTVITADLVPLRERGKFQGYGNVAYAVSLILAFFLRMVPHFVQRDTYIFFSVLGWFCFRCSIGWIHY